MAFSKIVEMDEIDHILHRPDMYIGSLRTKVSDEYILTETSPEPESDETVAKVKRIVKKEFSNSPGLARIFIEVLSNAIDNIQRSKAFGVPCKKIKVSIDKETGETKVWNDGLFIPITLDETQNNLYKHSIIFGKMRTSTNYNDQEERLGSGRNGVGVKLANVLSKSFRIKAVDSTNHLSFSQTWENNMRTVGAPKVKACAIAKGFTEVTWFPDFEKFYISDAKYSDDIYAQFLKYVYDTSLIAAAEGVDVYFNDEVVSIKTLKQYSYLYLSPTDERIELTTKDSTIVITSSTEFEAISFVNGINTPLGGVHVDAWAEKLLRPVIEYYTEKDRPTVDIKDVKKFFRLFVVCSLPNPEFTSQSKTQLTSPTPKTAVDEKEFKRVCSKICGWTNTKGIDDIINGKELVALKKTTSKKRNGIIENYDRANKAGSKDSDKCTLAVVEGLSAKTFVTEGLTEELFGRKGKDWVGILCIRGKLINVRKSSVQKITGNKEITSIIQALGLKYGVDYTQDDNFHTLNYGRLMIMTDADVDGKHIAGLIINFIHKLFPTLLQRKEPFLVDMRTPLAKFHMKGGEEKIFYNLYDADEFYLANTATIKHVDYYKGLASNTNEDAHEVFGKRIISYVTDKTTNDVMELCFGKNGADMRKEWMNTYNPVMNSFVNADTLEKAVSAFLNEEFIVYSIYSCGRAVPHLMDGWKKSQRKIAFSAFKKGIKTDYKVKQFSGYVAEHSGYHHGEDNLGGTIVNMTQDFTGSNNIPFFTKKGQFGSRLELGADAGDPRYIHILENAVINTIFKKDDEPLFKNLVDDGVIVEPEFYTPIIPMILVNGCMGIGTGWSSTIPTFNPLDIVKAIRAWLEEGCPTTNAEDAVQMSAFPEMVPWFRGFTGEVVKCQVRGQTQFVCRGVIDKSEPNKIIVTEIPVDMSIDKFKQFIEKKVESKDYKAYKEYNQPNKPYFVIDEFPEKTKATIKTLGLESNINLTNMVLFDCDNKIRKYSSVEEILEDFCITRYKYYTLRKASLLEKYEAKTPVLRLKIKFLKDVISGKLTIGGRSIETIYADMEKLGYNEFLNIKLEEDDGEEGKFKFLLAMPMASLTDKKVLALESELAKILADILVIKGKTETAMWNDDLDEFVKSYEVWLKDITAKDAKYTPKEVPKKRGKKV